MLQTIRDKTSGWIAYLVIGLISIPFALWGINSYLGGGEQKPAAVVDGVDITPQQLDFAYGRYRDRLASMFGGTLPAAFADENTLKEQVLTQLIEEQVLRAYINNKGFRVGDDSLFENIQSMSVFQQDGKFDKEQYRNQLASQGYQPSQFEAELRRSLEMQQLGEALKSSAFLTPVQRDLYNQINNQQRKLRVISIANKPEAITVPVQEVEEYYKSHSAQYMNPAKVKVDFIEISVDSLKNSIDVSEDEILARYDSSREQLTTPETRKASHILLTVKSDADQAQQDEVKQKIEELKARIDQGEDFATLARESSQDPGSAADGGDLGEVEKGMMVKPFETTLFAMNEGEVSDPVKTQFGWHLIKLNKISGGQTKSFDEARDQLKQEIATEKAESEVYDLAESLSNTTYEQPDSLQPAADQLGLKIHTSEWFTRSAGTGIAENEKVRQAAFSDEVLQQKRNSEALELGNNRVAVIHLNEYKEAELRPLSEVHAQIMQELKVKKGREQAQQKGKELLQEIKKGSKTFDVIATENELEINDAGFVNRQSVAVSSDVLNAAFSMPHPENGSAQFEGISEVNGNYSIVELSAIQVEDKKDGPEAKQKIDNLIQSAADSNYRAMIKALTANADIIRTPVSELE
jgi:peptidyl-prolyl cis-trans isomerase D